MNIPIRLISTVFLNQSSGIGPSLPSTRPAKPIPAQPATIDRFPKRVTASSTAAFTAASSVTSHSANAHASPSSFASASPGSFARSAMTTFAPFATSARAVAAPSPEAPPETRQPLP